MSKRRIAYIGLGSNVGDREVFLETARRAIAALPETRFLGETPVEETAPVGPIEQRPFLNQMVSIETALDPRTLLDELQEIETKAGRVRAERWGPRTLDLDIVMLEGERVTGPDLVVPHPELANRDFWQRELALLRRDEA